MGYSGVDFDPDEVSISLIAGENKATIVDCGVVMTYEDPAILENAEAIMKNKDIRINVSLNDGDSTAVAYGCDLTYDYVKINAEYTT